MSVKFWQEKEFSKLVPLLGLTLVGIGILLWGGILWLGALVSILLITTMALFAVSVFVFKIPVYGQLIGSILIMVSIILLLITGVTIIWQIFDISSAFTLTNLIK